MEGSSDSENRPNVPQYADNRIIDIGRALETLDNSQDNGKKALVEVTRTSHSKVHQAFVRYVRAAEPHLPELVPIIEARGRRSGNWETVPMGLYFSPKTIEIVYKQNPTPKLNQFYLDLQKSMGKMQCGAWC